MRSDDDNVTLEREIRKELRQAGLPSPKGGPAFSPTDRFWVSLAQAEGRPRAREPRWWVAAAVIMLMFAAAGLVLRTENLPVPLGGYSAAHARKVGQPGVTRGPGVPASFTPQTTRSTAIHLASAWLQQIVPEERRTDVVTVKLITRKDAEAQQGGTFADYPPYLWSVRMKGPFSAGGRTYPYAVVYVDTSTKTVEGVVFPNK